MLFYQMPSQSRAPLRSFTVPYSQSRALLFLHLSRPLIPEHIPVSTRRPLRSPSKFSSFEGPTLPDGTGISARHCRARSTRFPQSCISLAKTRSDRHVSRQKPVVPFSKGLSLALRFLPHSLAPRRAVSALSLDMGAGPLRRVP